MKDHHRSTLSRREFLRTLGGGAAASALLAACGGTTATPPAGGQPTAGAAAAPAGGASGDVQFWDMVWGPPEYIDTSKKLIEQFNSQNPNIKASYQSTPWSSWPQVFTTAIGSGTAPDISTGGGYQAVQYYPQGAILEIDDVIAGMKSDDFLPGMLETSKYGEHYIGVPWNFDVRVPWYYKDMFAKANVKEPTNWDELRAAAKALTTGTQYGIVFAANGPLGWQQMFGFIYNNGGGLFTADGKLDVMNDRNVEALTFISNLVKDGSVHPGSAGFTSDDGRKAFGSGAAAMTWDGANFGERFPDKKANLGILAPLPGPHGDKGTIKFVNNIMLYKPSKNPDATKAFLKWWSENQKPLWTEGHLPQLPARVSLANDPYFQNNPFTKQVLDQWVPLTKTLGEKKPGTFPVLGDIDSGGMLNTLAADILQGKDVKESLQKAEAALKALKTLTQ